MTSTSWLPGLLVLAGSLFSAAVFLWFSRRRALPLSETADQLADRDRQVAVAMEQLQELSADAHHLSPDQLSQERNALEQEAVEALRAKANVKTEATSAPAPSPAPATGSGFWAAHPTLKGALLGASVALFFGGLAWWVNDSSKPRGDRQEMTGMQPKGEMSANAEADAQTLAVAEARRKFNADPENPQASSQLVHELLRSQEFTEAAQLTDKTLAAHPEHLETQIHASVLKGLRGQPETALKELEALGKRSEEQATEAWLFAGALALDLKDVRRALRAFESYAQRVPSSEHPPALRQGIALLKQQVAMLDGKPVDAVPGRPLSKDHPPMPSGAPGASAPFAGGMAGPPPLSPEAIEAVNSVEKTPELLAGLAKRVEEAEADLAHQKFQDALDKYKQVVPVQPENGRAKAGMAWALIGLGKPMAARVWQVAVSSDPSAVKALGERLARLGDKEGAKALKARLAAEGR